jgi:pimeloyl-ACP methyl ester carboxylesterase
MMMPSRVSPFTRRILVQVAVLIAIPSLFFAIWCYNFATQMATPPHRPVGAVPKDISFPVEAVRFKATDGVQLSGWFLPCPGATRAVVLLHGGRRNRLGMVSHAKLFRAHGYAVLLYDARGHGESDDAPDPARWHIADDVVGAVDFLRGRGFQQFGLLGLSQGGVTIASTAGRLHDLCWVVLECTPINVGDIVRNDIGNALPGLGWLGGLVALPMIQWKMGVSLKDFALGENAAKFRCPVLVIAGGADDRVRPAEARDLYARITAPKSFWLIPGAPHTNFYLYAHTVKADYEKRVLTFIDAAVNPAASAARH